MWTGREATKMFSYFKVPYFAKDSTVWLEHLAFQTSENQKSLWKMDRMIRKYRITFCSLTHTHLLTGKFVTLHWISFPYYWSQYLFTWFFSLLWESHKKDKETSDPMANIVNICFVKACAAMSGMAIFIADKHNGYQSVHTHYWNNPHRPCLKVDIQSFKA